MALLQMYCLQIKSKKEGMARVKKATTNLTIVSFLELYNNK